MSMSTYSNASVEPINYLSVGEIHEAIQKLQEYSHEHILAKIEHNGCKNLFEMFADFYESKHKDNTVKPPVYGSVNELYGVNVIERDDIPKGEMHFVDTKGIVFKRFKL